MIYLLLYALVNGSNAFLTDSANWKHFSTQSYLSCHRQMFPGRNSEQKWGKGSHYGDSSRRPVFFGRSLREVNMHWDLFKVFGLFESSKLLTEISCNANTVEMTFDPRKGDVNTLFHDISQLTCHLYSLLAAAILDGLDSENFPTHWSPSQSIDHSDSIPKI